jgi:aconitate hydratase
MTGFQDITQFTARLGVDAATLPRAVRIILEAALRGVAMGLIEEQDCLSIARWQPGDAGRDEWRFPIGRVLMQDASGIPVLADLAAMRDAVAEAGGNLDKVGLAVPTAIVLDHSIETDRWGTAHALADNMAMEFARNTERYGFVHWAEQAFAGLTVVPPGNGIVHQVHLERLAEIVSTRDGATFCDTVIGTDSHTTMVNGLGVLGWGVGGIEAEAALLGQPISLAVPEIIGIELVGAPAPGIYGADLALAMTEWLRCHKVVGAFLEFFGAGVDALAVADRAGIANMAPEYGAQLALFPTDAAVLRYMADNGRDPQCLTVTENHLRRQGLFGNPMPGARFDRTLRFDLGTVVPSLAGPSLPQQRVALPDVPASFAKAFADAPRDGRVVLAAITSCTNTANMRGLVAAGLAAKAALAAGLKPPAYVKTVFAPGSRATVERLERAGLLQPLADIGFHVAAYGCGPCMGNSGSLADGIEASLADGGVAAAVLSGNRNFEGRIHRAVRAAYLGNPLLVVTYALAGRIDTDISDLLKQISPDAATVGAALALAEGQAVNPAWFRPTEWDAIGTGSGVRFDWSPNSTYFVPPPFFEEAPRDRLHPVRQARPLLVLGDAVTTDHISPIGDIASDGPAGAYLAGLGVAPADWQNYSARRVNHEVMIRGTFGNARLRNQLVDRAGPWTRHFPDRTEMTVDAAAARYAVERVPLVVLAGHDYGTGSARDWAAKGTALLGIRAVLARSFERIHRSNLVALGVLPIQIDGDEAPWAGCAEATSVTVSFDLDPATARPGQAIEIELQLDGQLRRLAGTLKVLTNSELQQLRTGSLFTQSLRRVLAAS